MHSTQNCSFFSENKVFISGEDAASRVIQNNYTVVNSNVTDLRDAKIICLGEIHTSDIHKRLNGAFINTLCDDNNDIILTEYYGDMHKYATANLTIKKWDNLINQKAPILDIGESIKKDKSNGFTISLGAFAIGFFGFSISAPLVIFPSLFLGAYGGYKLFKSRNEEVEFNKIINDFSTCPKEHKWFGKVLETTKSVQNGVPVRNKHMTKIIEENLVSSRKIYVLAGSAHLIPMPCPERCTFPEHTAVNEGCQILQDYLKDHKFAILVPNDTVGIGH